MSDSLVNEAFKDTASAAIAMLDKLDGTADAVVPATPAPVEATPTAVVPEPTEPTAPSTTPDILDVSPDTKVRIKVGGEEKVVSAKEYTEILQRTDVFTQRLQGMAKQREQLENHYAGVEAQLQQRALFLEQQAQQIAQQGDPVQRLVQQLQQNQQVQSGPKESDIATIGEVQAAIQAFQAQQQAQLAQLQQQNQQDLINAREQAKFDVALAQDQQRVAHTVQEILNSPDGKLLQEINPLAESVIRYNALKMGPQNVEQAIENLHVYTKGWVEKVRGTLAQQSTATAVKTAKTTLEPPTGTPATSVKAPQPRALKPDGSIDWTALRARSMTYLE